MHGIEPASQSRDVLVFRECYVYYYLLTVINSQRTLRRKCSMTQVISAVQEKGGAGKTTLLGALACLMADDGMRVAVIDTDPQGHSEAWAKKDKANIDWLCEDNDEKLIPTVKSLKRVEHGYDAILIDTAGYTNPSNK